MNYFELHIGDYEAATAHLTMLEDAAYGRMLRVYYRTEAPLPADIKKVCRLMRAQSKPERDAVEQVLREFFELQEDGWHQTRADAELHQFRATEPEREARKANEEARIKRHREERAALFKLLNDNGQHAPWNTKIEELRRLAAPFSNAPETPPATSAVTQPATAPVTPATAPHGNVSPPPTSHLPVPKGEGTEKGTRKRAAPPPDRPEEVTEQTWGDWLQLRRGKSAPVTETVLDGAKAEAAKAGMSLDAFLRIWCLRGSQGLMAEWLKPEERRAGQEAPAWRTEQWETTAAYAGRAAAKRPGAPTTTTQEIVDVPARSLG